MRVAVEDDGERARFVISGAEVDVAADDAQLAGRLLDDLLITPVERLHDWVAEYAGRAFSGAIVEWIAAPDPARDDPAAPHEQGPFVVPEEVRWRGHVVRVPPLDVQLRACEARGLSERAALIRAAR